MCDLCFEPKTLICRRSHQNNTLMICSEGICHVYVDEHADAEVAVRVAGDSRAAAAAAALAEYLQSMRRSTPPPPATLPKHFCCMKPHLRKVQALKLMESSIYDNCLISQGLALASFYSILISRAGGVADAVLRALRAAGVQVPAT